MHVTEAERNAAKTELVETRIALMNSEACRAQAERDAARMEAERDAARADIAEVHRILKCPENMTLTDWCQASVSDFEATDSIMKTSDETRAELKRARAELAETTTGRNLALSELHAARADAERMAKWAQKYYGSGAPHGHLCGQSPCICGRNELGAALAATRKQETSRDMPLDSIHNKER